MLLHLSETTQLWWVLVGFWARWLWSLSWPCGKENHNKKYKIGCKIICSLFIFILRAQSRIWRCYKQLFCINYVKTNINDLMEGGYELCHFIDNKFDITREAFVPPKPKEFFIKILLSDAHFDGPFWTNCIRPLGVESGSTRFRQEGSWPSRQDNIANTLSTLPAPPSRWPIADLQLVTVNGSLLLVTSSSE